VKKEVKEEKQDGDEPPAKKVKSENDDAMKTQSKKIFKIRDNLETLKQKNLQDLLEFNHQQIPPGKDRLLDLLADVMTFGALKKCPECKRGDLYYRY
jgi:poly [ADP-ribose] polymerase 1